jgi:hypothetical protein
MWRLKWISNQYDVVKNSAHDFFTTSHIDSSFVQPQWIVGKNGTLDFLRDHQGQGDSINMEHFTCSSG